MPLLINPTFGLKIEPCKLEDWFLKLGRVIFLSEDR